MPAVINPLVTLWLIARSPALSIRGLDPIPESELVALCPAGAVPNALSELEALELAEPALPLVPRPLPLEPRPLVEPDWVWDGVLELFCP